MASWPPPPSLFAARLVLPTNLLGLSPHFAKATHLRGGARAFFLITTLLWISAGWIGALGKAKVVRTMKRTSRINVCWVFLLALVSLGKVPPPAWGEERKPVCLDIRVPEDAELEVNGHKTKSRGELRRFESPPVVVGRTYEYSLKVSWHGHTLTRRLQMQPERPVTLDLRKDLQALAEPKPAGSFALLAPPALMLRVDDNVAFPLRVKRFDCPDAISIHFENLPKGITAPDVMLSKGQSENNAILFAAADAQQGSHEIRIVAASGPTKDDSTIKIIVTSPETRSQIKTEKGPVTSPETKAENNTEPKLEIPVEPKLEVKPEMKPGTKPSPGLRLVSPVRVALHPGQSKYVEVLAMMESGEPLPAEPTVTLVSLPESKLTNQVWSISDFKSNPSSYTVGFVVKAASDAPAGEQKVTVRAAADKARTEHVLHFLVRPLERKPNPGARIAPVLQLVLPASIEVSVGKTKYIEVQVKTEDGSPLPGEPQVAMEASPGSRLRSSPWSSSYKAGQSACTVGLVVTADPGGSVGDRDVRLRALVGNEKAERTLSVTVKTSSERPAKP